MFVSIKSLAVSMESVSDSPQFIKQGVNPGNITFDAKSDNGAVTAEFALRIGDNNGIFLFDGNQTTKEIHFKASIDGTFQPVSKNIEIRVLNSPAENVIVGLLLQKKNPDSQGHLKRILVCLGEL